MRINRSELTIDLDTGGFWVSTRVITGWYARRKVSILIMGDEDSAIRVEKLDGRDPTDAVADEDGDAILISTPKGRNWFWREWVRGTNGRERGQSWTAPTVLTQT